MAAVRTGSVLSWVREFDVGLRATQRALTGHAFGCARGDGHIRLGAANERFLRHRFSPKSKSVATLFSLPKRIHVAKEAVSAAWKPSDVTEANNNASQTMLQ